jgi:uncharacterized protein YndB with AHSA1/START domain
MPLEANRVAPAFAERELFMAAPRERVWEVLSGIDDWPQWQSGVSRAQLDGPLRAGTSFRFKAGGMSITSTLRKVTPPFHIAWEGKAAAGLRAVHSWHLYHHPGGTVVVTAESFEGAVARLLRPLMQRVLNRALADGLSDLKREAEISGE